MSKTKKKIKVKQTVALKNSMTNANSNILDSKIQSTRVATTIPAKRRLDRSFKINTLNELDSLQRGEKGLYLRQRGLYSSQVSLWRKELKTIPKESLSVKEELTTLKKENTRLQKRNETLEGLIELQKKMAEILNPENLEEPKQ
jgi:predicted nuclease with TOPRIM domain